MPVNRRYLQSLAAHGQLTPAGLEYALDRLRVLPSLRDWQRLTDRLLLVAGILLILAGVICFFAFNWNALHRATKLLLVAAPLLATALLAWRQGTDNLIGQALLGSAAILTGVLLATAGQIYQSGADSELLFAGWAVLILPWVLASRAAWLWLFWLLLLNAAIALYLFGRLEIWALLWLRDGIFWAPIALNLFAIAIWESLWSKLEWLQAAYAPRLLALLTGGFATVLTSLWWFFDQHDQWQALQYTPFAYLVWAGATLWHYQSQRRDLVPLAIAALSLIIVVTGGLVKWLTRSHGEVAAFLFIGLAVAGMTALAATWLRQLTKSWQETAHV